MNDRPTSARWLRSIHIGIVFVGTLVIGAKAQAQGIQVGADGRLSVDVRDADPVAVISQIADQASFKLVVSEGVEATPGSWSFNDVPVEVGISRVLGNVDYILTRNSAGDPNTGIARIWILSKSTPANSVSVTQVDTNGDPTDPQTVQKALRDIAKLARSKDTDRTQALLAYLDHPHRRVRVALASALGRVGDQEAVLALGQLMFGDAESSVRRSAATALAKNQSVEAVEMLRGGLEDEDPQVKQHVRKILTEIDGG